MKRIFCIMIGLFAAFPAWSQSAPTAADELAYVTKVFEKIQPRSFAMNRELCGYLGKDASGRFVTTRIATGSEDGCTLPYWPEKFDVLASFHTHSTYSPDYNSEFPSSIDMESDEASGIDGWIATPGGRIWYVDSSEMVAYQVCGESCVPQDPNYVDEGQTIRPSYSYRAIVKGER